MSTKELQEFIRQGENETLDFKQTISDYRKIARNVVAFANTKGGKLLVGVKDNGKVLGIRSDEERYMLEGAAEYYSNPPIVVNFEEITIEGKEVLVADIPESENKPHYAEGEDGKWWAYIRVKDQCLLASKVMLDVMKGNTREIPTRVQYGKPEKSLLKYLESNDRITLKEFCKLANISRRRANRIIVNLVRMGVLKVLTHEKTEFYTV